MKILKTLFYAFASSRPFQATLSLSQPLFAAFLAVGGIPNPNLLLLLTVSGITGMFSVFALNDFLDYDIDRKIIAANRKNWDVDSMFARHPFAAGLIKRWQQALWIIVLGAISLAILYVLNTVAFLLYAAVIAAETLYCRLSLVSELKTLVAGTLVAMGALIGWFAAGGGFNALVLPFLFIAFFAWEIGGRNIANDLSDVKQDRKSGIKTISSVYGPVVSSYLVVLLVLVTLAANLLIGIAAELGIYYLTITGVLGIFSLLVPSLRLIKNPAQKNALEYFNKASVYPVFMFAAAIAVYVIAY